MSLSDLVIPPQAKAAFIGVIIAVLVFAGWMLRGWYEDSRELAELKGAEKAIQAAMERESTIAERVQKQIASLRANERVIEREKLKVIDRPVYRAECIDADGMRLLQETARPGASAGAAPGVSASDRAGRKDGR